MAHVKLESIIDSLLSVWCCTCEQIRVLDKFWLMLVPTRSAADS